MNRHAKQSIYFGLFRFCGLLVIASLVILLGYIVSAGIGMLSIEFLTEAPRRGMTQGGIFTPLMGTLYLMVIVMAFSIPVGVFSAVYLVEYQKNRLFGSFLRIIIGNLAGVPSIVYGLLGLGLFVYFLNFGFSLIAAGLTLGILVLPIVISASREAILAVPPSVREASLALGATKWQTVRHHVLPYAMPGILTGIILSISRAAGETAPILVTGAAFYLPELPDSLFSEFMALPFHIYAVATQTNTGLTGGMIYGSALVLIMLVVGMNLVAIYIRKKYRAKYKW